MLVKRTRIEFGKSEVVFIENYVFNGVCTEHWKTIMGDLHRENGLPAVTNSLGYESYWLRGKFLGQKAPDGYYVEAP